MGQGGLTKVGVIGCGLMGAGIAELSARAGVDTVVVELDQRALDAGRGRIEASFARLVDNGKLTADVAAAAQSTLSFSIDPEAFSDRELVIEAVVESEEAKSGVLATLDKVVQPDAIFASNTSSIPIMRLGMATGRPAQVVGMHFFQPAQVQPLVEIVPSMLTSEETIDVAHHFAADALGKTVIRSKDRAGFIVNALLVPYLLSAIRMAESDFATIEDIDTGMMKGCAHPMGPLALCDLVGLDTLVHVAHSLYEEFKEPLYAPPPLLARMVEAGTLGRKSGRGFYDYRN
jgi:3-hydroxybutyryl-CoA dehydrogenase